MHSNLSHTSHEPSSKKKDSIKEKNREKRERERKKKTKYILHSGGVANSRYCATTEKRQRAMVGQKS